MNRVLETNAMNRPSVVVVAFAGLAFFMSVRPAFGQEQSPVPVTVIRVDHIDTAQAADIVEKMFKSTPGFEVKALLKLKSVAVRGNPTAARDAKDLVRRLDQAAPHAPRTSGFISGPLRLDDLTIAVVCIQWIMAKEQAKKSSTVSSSLIGVRSAGRGS
jgi:Bacterial type II/III secretion system short domain